MAIEKQRKSEVIFATSRLRVGKSRNHQSPKERRTEQQQNTKEKE